MYDKRIFTQKYWQSILNISLENNFSLRAIGGKRKWDKRITREGGGGGILSSVRVKLRDKGRNRNTTNNKEGRIKSTQMEAEKKGIN